MLAYRQKIYQNLIIIRLTYLIFKYSTSIKKTKAYLEKKNALKSEKIFKQIDVPDEEFQPQTGYERKLFRKGSHRYMTYICYPL